MTDDTISRQAATQTALDFIVEYLGGAFDEDFQKKLTERINALPSAQPEPEQNTHSEQRENDKLWVKMGETCTDTISRQAAIDAFEDTTFTKNEIRRRLSELPSAQPDRDAVSMMEDGTLSITVDMDITNVGRILLNQRGTNCGTLYYPDGTTRKGIWKTTRLDHEAMGERPLLWYCSACDVCSTQPTKYCPHCGARMTNG